MIKKLKKAECTSFVQLYIVRSTSFYVLSRHAVKVTALVFLDISPVTADPVVFPRLPRAGNDHTDYKVMCLLNVYF